ncbi:hypothetical protein I3843_09G033400 [Carya illinoinensis]|uniref:3,9-dihydroxypterocarpan 6A-monooxygenase n=1 Tax=Carya illinoinensis TaxID=32201 RepID=A0A8T1PFQ3_CARIL|nr:3,9-dihydroxypterocarpan 6A-monooxygenase-like [Carya illinoinensis]KAG6640858.1 hypothetical protein CIPAW_09G033000 [Carya illinoinensis]KAG7961768.1 hypothetical protein I3843_09G033400 [Carya illinoinensis]
MASSTGIANLWEYSFLFFIWIVSVVVVRFLIKTCTSSRDTLRCPPSPLALPIIGHLHLLSSKLPQSFQDLARRYGPLMQLRIGATTFVIASSATVAKEILRTHDGDFASRFEFGPAEYNIYSGIGFITGPYGTYWRFMKKLCITKLFAGPQLARFSRIRELEIQKLLKSVLKSSKEGEACDLAVELTTLTNNLLCSMALSKTCSDNVMGAKEIRRLVVEIMELGTKLGAYEAIGPLKKFDIFGYGKNLVEAMWRYDHLFDQIIEFYEDDMVDAQDGNEEADLMSIVLETYKDTNAEVKLTKNQIKFFFLELFFSTIDTSSAAIQWAMAELINHPQQFKKLREEIDRVVGSNRLVSESDVPNLPFLQAVVKEGLRLRSPTPIIHRECTKDCKITGFDVKANSKILINAYAIMRDPEHWNDPLEFMPERFLVDSNDEIGQRQIEMKSQDFHYLPFGGGRRGCIGGTHALLVSYVAVGALTQCFDWKVKGGDKVDIEVGSGFSGAMALPLACYPITRFDPF